MNDKHTEVPHPSCPLCSLLVSIPEQRVCICYNEWPWHAVTTQSPQLPGGFTLGVVHSACLENVRHISTTVLSYRFWSGFIVLRALLVLYVLPSSLTFLRPPHKFIVSRKAGLSPIFASYFFSHSSSSLQSLGIGRDAINCGCAQPYVNEQIKVLWFQQEIMCSALNVFASEFILWS